MPSPLLMRDIDDAVLLDALLSDDPRANTKQGLREAIAARPTARPDWMPKATPSDPTRIEPPATSPYAQLLRRKINPGQWPEASHLVEADEINRDIYGGIFSPEEVDQLRKGVMTPEMNQKAMTHAQLASTVMSDPARLTWDALAAIILAKVPFGAKAIKSVGSSLGGAAKGVASRIAKAVGGKSGAEAVAAAKRVIGSLTQDEMDAATAAASKSPGLASLLEQEGAAGLSSAKPPVGSGRSFWRGLNATEKARLEELSHIPEQQMTMAQKGEFAALNAPRGIKKALEVPGKVVGAATSVAGALWTAQMLGLDVSKLLQKDESAESLGETGGVDAPATRGSTFTQKMLAEHDRLNPGNAADAAAYYQQVSALQDWMEKEQATSQLTKYLLHNLARETTSAAELDRMRRVQGQANKILSGVMDYADKFKRMPMMPGMLLPSDDHVLAAGSVLAGEPWLPPEIKAPDYMTPSSVSQDYPNQQGQTGPAPMTDEQQALVG